MHIEPTNLWLAIVAAINFILAFIIYFKAPKTKANLFYMLTVLSAAFWTFCMSCTIS